MNLIWGQLSSNIINYITITLQLSGLHYITSIFKCKRLNYNYFVNVIDYITDYIYCHDNQYIGALCYFVSCASVQYLLFFLMYFLLGMYSDSENLKICIISQSKYENYILNLCK